MQLQQKRHWIKSCLELKARWKYEAELDLGQLMADTIGSLVDKLCTVDLKMWNNQEILYEIRRLTFEEFQEKYLVREEDQRVFYECIQKCCDLNYQRNQLIDEIDKTVVKALKGEIKPDDLVQLKHKTY